MAKITQIITQYGSAINSQDGWIYGIDAEHVFKTAHHVYLIAMKKMVHKDGSFDITDKIIILDLKMYAGKRSLVINKLIDKACNVLQSLLEAIERGDRVWDAVDHDLKEKEEMTSVEGTIVKPSGFKPKEETTSVEGTTVEGTTVKPSKC